MKTQTTLSEMLKNGSYPIFFEIGTETVDVWVTVEYSHKFWRTMNKKYVQKICRENGYDYKKMKMTTSY